MSTESAVKIKKANPLKDYFALIVIVVSITIGILVYLYILGDPANFENGDPIKGHDPANFENGDPIKGHPKQGNYLGIMYKGGFLVPLAMGLILMNLIFSIERFMQ